jgi:hypothetical protein
MSKNDITGDRLVSRTTSDAYRDHYDAIFGKKKETTMRKIYYWPDGHWCDKCDLPYTDHKSDDFSSFEVSYELMDEAIDNMVQGALRAERCL